MVDYKIHAGVFFFKIVSEVKEFMAHVYSEQMSTFCVSSCRRCAVPFPVSRLSMLTTARY